MYRGALIGLGQVALNGHLPAWQKNTQFEIVAGIDTTESQKELYRKAVPNGRCYSTLEECDELKLDFVDICTPPHTHFSIVKKALERNLNVICEKPLVLSEDEIKLLEESSVKSSKVLLTVHNWKYAPICLKITELLRKNAIGKIQHCAWYVLRNGPAKTTVMDNWRLDPKKAGGGILIDHGWHAFYLILNWLQKEPKSVHATLENRQYEDLPVEDTAKIKLEFENGSSGFTTAEVFLTWASRLRRNWGVVEGEGGTLQIEDNLLRLTKKENTSQDFAESYSFDQPLSQGSHHPEWFQSVVNEFLNELEHQDQHGKNLKVAKSCLRLIERAKESHRRNSRIPF